MRFGVGQRSGEVIDRAGRRVQLLRRFDQLLRRFVQLLRGVAQLLRRFGQLCLERPAAHHQRAQLVTQSRVERRQTGRPLRGRRRERLDCAALHGGDVLLEHRLRTIRHVLCQDAAARPREETPYCHCAGLVGADQPFEFRRDLGADDGDPESVPVQELERRVGGANVGPDLPGAEIMRPHVDVVQQHDTARAHLRQPGLEIVADGVAGMEPIQVQQVDGAVAEMTQRVIERRSHQRREGAVTLIVIGLPLGVDRLGVKARLGIARPRVHGISSRVETEMLAAWAKAA